MIWRRTIVIVFGALIITTLGIDAADTWRGSSSTLLGQLIATSDGACPEGMAPTPQLLSVGCVDMFEASASVLCPESEPRNTLDSQANISDPACAARSVAAVLPWRFITRDQAQVACLRAGKRLPTSAEWHAMALGTPDTEVCNSATGEVRSTDVSACQSALGVYDLIGNVWEWTDGDVVDGYYDGRKVAPSGYVTEVAFDGIAIESGAQPSDLYAHDYIWSIETGVYGVIRGGFYGSREDAGVYSAHMDTLPSAATGGLGFRCVL